jgi:hypothetical protein
MFMHCYLLEDVVFEEPFLRSRCSLGGAVVSAASLINSMRLFFWGVCASLMSRV